MKPALVAGLAVLLAACQSTPEPSSGEAVRIIELEDGSLAAVDNNGDPVNSPQARMAIELMKGLRGNGSALNEDEIWAVDDEGNYRHIQSGGICPKNWGHFSRRMTNITFANGMDVSCNYGSDGASFTFYFYQTGELLEAEVESTLKVIEMRSPMTQRVEPFVAVGPNLNFAGGAVEGENARGELVRNGLFLTEHEGWRIKLRTTYDASSAEENEAAANAMMMAQLEYVQAEGMSAEPENVAIIEGDEI